MPFAKHYRAISQNKLLLVALWSLVSIGGAMCLDYIVTIVILRDYPGYTPIETLFISSLITVPITYALVGSRFKLRKAYDDLALSRDQVISADQKKTQFFANVSHELRTPLNAILGFSELLSLEIFAGKRVEYAALIHASGSHLLDLVNDLLDLSCIEAGRFELREETLDLRDIMGDCAKIIEPRLRSAKLKLVIAADNDLPLMYADKRAIKQILLNLLANAIKFSPEGNEIEAFTTLSKSGELNFGVQDWGNGIAQDELGKIFERFGQGHHEIARAEQGTGLGLPIVKGLSEILGGSVALESTLGVGTRVTVWLPANRIEAADLQARSA